MMRWAPVFLLGLAVACEAPTSDSGSPEEPSGPAADYFEVHMTSNSYSPDAYLLGRGYDLTAEEFRESPITASETMTRDWGLPGAFTSAGPLFSMDELRGLLVTSEATNNIMADTRTLSLGAPQEVVDFLHSLPLDDRTYTWIHSAGGSSELFKQVSPTTILPAVLNAVQGNNLAAVRGQYGDSFVGEVLHGYRRLFVLSLHADKNSEYPWVDVRDALIRLEDHNYDTGDDYGETELAADLVVVRSKGVALRTLAYSNQNVPGIDAVQTIGQWLEYLQTTSAANITEVSPLIYVDLWRYRSHIH